MARKESSTAESGITMTGGLTPATSTSNSVATYSRFSKVNKTIFVVIRTTNVADATQELEVRALTVEYEWDAEERKVVGFKGENLKIRPSQVVEAIFD